MSKALKLAIEHDDPEATRKAATQVKDLNRRLPGADRPVIYAVRRNAAAALEALLEAGASPEGEDSYVGFSLFVIAAQAGHLEVLDALVRRGRVTSEQIEHALMTCAVRARRDSLKWIIETCRPPLPPMLLRVSADAETAQVLLDHGADPNAEEDLPEAGRPRPLHAAAASLDNRLVQTLIAAGAAVNARDALGRTPLMRAAAAAPSARFLSRNTKPRDPLQTIQLLLQHGADGALVDVDGNDALVHYLWEAMREQEDPEPGLVTALEQAGGTPGPMALFMALRGRDLPAVERAIAAGVDVNRPHPGGASALIWACGEDPAFMRALLKAGADPNRPTRDGLPVIEAASSGDLQNLKQLVDAGADVHATFADGSSELMNAYLAAEYGDHEEVLQFLKQLGARRPVPARWEPLQAGVGSWNDFSELLVKGAAGQVGAALARVLGGTCRAAVFGETFRPGETAYIVALPREMGWCNLFRVAPRRRRWEAIDRSFLEALARAAGAPVLSIEYSDTSDAASILRVEPDGQSDEDAGWDRGILEEVVGALGKEAPAWAKERLTKMPKDAPSSTQYVQALAERERLVLAAYAPLVRDDAPIEIGFPGYPPEAFEEVAWVTT